MDPTRFTTQFYPFGDYVIQPATGSRSGFGSYGEVGTGTALTWGLFGVLVGIFLGQKYEASLRPKTLREWRRAERGE